MSEESKRLQEIIQVELHRDIKEVGMLRKIPLPDELFPVFNPGHVEIDLGTMNLQEQEVMLGSITRGLNVNVFGEMHDTLCTIEMDEGKISVTGENVPYALGYLVNSGRFTYLLSVYSEIILIHVEGLCDEQGNPIGLTEYPSDPEEEAKLHWSPGEKYERPKAADVDQSEFSDDRPRIGFIGGVLEEAFDAWLVDEERLRNRGTTTRARVAIDETNPEKVTKTLVEAIRFGALNPFPFPAYADIDRENWQRIFVYISPYYTAQLTTLEIEAFKESFQEVGVFFEEEIIDVSERDGYLTPALSTTTDTVSGPDLVDFVETRWFDRFKSIMKEKWAEAEALKETYEAPAHGEPGSNIEEGEGKGGIPPLSRDPPH